MAKKVLIQNVRGEYLCSDLNWRKLRKDAMKFNSVTEAEQELDRHLIGWLGQVVFEIVDIEE